LHALAADRAAPAFDVIVVDDGSTDDTVASLQHRQFPFPVRVVTQQNCGPSTARNAGAARATGPVLLFLDDDVEPKPGMLAAHQMFHARRDHLLGVGDLPPIVDDSTIFGVTLRGWWDAMLDGIRRPGHRFGFRNVLTGHLSIQRHDFEALGGFDPLLRCHEDWDLGYRALKRGLAIRFVAGAVAQHRECSDLAKVLRRKFDEGVADVQLCERYPELGTVLPLRWPPASRKGRMMMRLAWMPVAASRVIPLVHRQMAFYERMRLRGRWRTALDLLLTYWYWSGVASVLPRRKAMSALSPTLSATLPSVFIDLEGGIDAACARLDAAPVDSVALHYRGFLVGVIPATPGLEPLRGEHLRAYLARHLRWALRRAIEQARAVPEILQKSMEKSVDTRRRMPHVRTPHVRDVELPPNVGATVDTQQRAAVPPIHHVA
jgi:glycosyltransferase involved in cell wall biosynthesis